MLAVVRSLKRLHVLGVLLLTLAFLAPAFETHACQPIDAGSSTVEQALGGGDLEPSGEPCPECGPACANGCCHAPHPAMIADPQRPDSQGGGYSPSRPWTHDVGAVRDRPSGPDRPPRL